MVKERGQIYKAGRAGDSPRTFIFRKFVNGNNYDFSNYKTPREKRKRQFDRINKVSQSTLKFLSDHLTGHVTQSSSFKKKKVFRNRLTSFYLFSFINAPF